VRPDVAYQSLVEVKSTISSLQRVMPGRPDESMLYNKPPTVMWTDALLDGALIRGGISSTTITARGSDAEGLAYTSIEVTTVAPGRGGGRGGGGGRSLASALAGLRYRCRRA
jgi:hypothetical protein